MLLRHSRATFNPWRRPRNGSTKNVLRHFSEYCKGAGLGGSGRDLRWIVWTATRSNRTLVEDHGTGRSWKPWRQFFGLLSRPRLDQRQPASSHQESRGNIKPADVVPYTPQREVAKIIAACDAIGSGPYERLRARAMVLFFDYTALRISDVATLARDRVQDGEILLRTQKTGGPVYLPIPEELQEALDALPAREEAEKTRYFFWNGITSRRAVVGSPSGRWRPCSRSPALKAHAHRFRHTLATELLGSGGTDRKWPTFWAIARQSSGSTTPSGPRPARRGLTT